MPLKPRKYNDEMRAALYHVLRDKWGDLSTSTGYGDWEGSQAWKNLEEVILRKAKLFKLPDAPNPQKQIQGFITECSDEQFAHVILAVSMADPEPGRSIFSDLKQYTQTLNAIGIPVKIEGDFRYGRVTYVGSPAGDESAEKLELLPAEKGSRKRELEDPLPETFEEIEEDTGYWMGRLGEGEVGSNWEYWVRTRLEKLKHKKKKFVDENKSVDDKTAADKIVQGLKNNKVVAIGIVVGIIVIAFATFAESIEKIWDFILRIVVAKNP